MFSGKLGRRTLTSLARRRDARACSACLRRRAASRARSSTRRTPPFRRAQILVTAIPDQGGQKWQATSDKNGNYIIGTLPKSGQYLVVASKEGVGADEDRAR